MKYRGGSRTAAASKMERFVIMVNGWKPLIVITKRSILDIAAVLDPSLRITTFSQSPLILQGWCHQCPSICSANQWTGFYMITVSVMKGLNLTCVS